MCNRPKGEDDSHGKNIDTERSADNLGAMPWSCAGSRISFHTTPVLKYSCPATMMKVKLL